MGSKETIMTVHGADIVEGRPDTDGTDDGDEHSCELRDDPVASIDIRYPHFTADEFREIADAVDEYFDGGEDVLREMGDGYYFYRITRGGDDGIHVYCDDERGVVNENHLRTVLEVTLSETSDKCSVGELHAERQRYSSQEDDINFYLDGESLMYLEEPSARDLLEKLH